MMPEDADEIPATQTDTMLPPSEKKSRRPRRTKAQMLADAAARPDAERTVIAPSLLADMAAEDTRDAVVRDMAHIVPIRPFDVARDRLAVVACLLALLALSVAIVALAR